MNSRIETIVEKKLIGKKTRMSFANNRTKELWQNFMPRRKEISHPAGTDLYSVEVYPNTGFFKNFDPSAEFEKWAAVEVRNYDSIPESMDKLIIPAGDYVIFPYKGKPSEAQKTYQYIYAQWLPNSEYELDNRPHFARMGEKYKGEHPDSEEEFWVPVRKK
jgi:AraC family transcriptional regulator